MIIGNVLLAPLITEKSTRQIGEENKYVFKVTDNASKNQIKQAIEKLYQVKVKKVNVCKISGKSHRALRTRKEFKGKDWKKAIACLKEGQKIEIFEIPTEEKKETK